MSDSAPATETIVPIKVPEPVDNAPPSLAEPASGPVAEMSGAVPQPDASAAVSKPIEESTTVNGATDATEPEPSKSVEEATTIAEPEKATGEQAPTTDLDADMKDADAPTERATEPEPPAPEPATDTNGTPASKAKRKSSTGIPEHRNKTLKKKQSKAKITNLDAKPGDYFLARLRSYPPWPSIVCDEAMLPDVLLTTRPVTAMQSDGTYKEPYVDDGKKVTDRTFAVMFLHTNEFGWIPNTDLAATDIEQMKNVSEKGKGKALLEAYKVGAEGHDLQHFKDMLMQHEAALQEDEAVKAEKEAEKAAKAEKKKPRKSEVKVDADVEMGDADEAPKKSTKKRKKEAESDDEETDKPAKTPKTTKLKLTTKTPTTTEKKPKEKAAKPKSEKKKKAQDSEEDVEVEKEDTAPLDPVEARKTREKEVLFLRHKLQKGFLSRDQEPSEAEMPLMATYIKKLENYGGDLEVNIIRNTKINKVLKGIVKLTSIPKDEEYHFRERSVKLLGVWNQLLGAEPTDAEKPANDEKDSPTTTNGVHKETEDKAEEKIEAKVEEPKEKTLPTEEAVDKVSAEVPAEAGDKAAAIDEIVKDEKPAQDTKTEASAAPAVEDKAPESAAAAAEVADVVKATE